MEKNIIGAVVAASHNRDFTNLDTVCIIKDLTPNSIYTIHVDSLKKYRYIRIVQNPQNCRMLLSELTCRDNADNELNGELFIPSPTQQLFYDPDLAYDTKQGELKSILSNNEYVNYATIPT